MTGPSASPTESAMEARASGHGRLGLAMTRTWWNGLAARERAGVAVAGLAVVLALGWWLLLGPALRTLQRTPGELATLEAQLQSMQALAAEARALRSMPPPPAAQAADALRQATESLGDKARLTLQGERATVALTAVSPTALRQWLHAVRTGARARPMEVTLTHAPTPGGGAWSGSVVFALGGGGV